MSLNSMLSLVFCTEKVLQDLFSKHTYIDFGVRFSKIFSTRNIFSVQNGVTHISSVARNKKNNNT